MSINLKIKECFPHLSIKKDNRNDALFKGRNLPDFVKDFLINHFSDKQNGNLDIDGLMSYLEEKIVIDAGVLRRRLIDGESVDLIARFNVRTDMAQGKVRFTMLDLSLSSDAIVSPTLLEKNQIPLTDGEHWGQITLNWIEPEGRRNAYTLMTSYIPLQQGYRLNIEDYFNAREEFTTEEWIDFLITTLGYNPEEFAEEQKLETISRLLVLVEPRLNMMELGPKGTGKSYMFINLSQYAWLLAGGRTSRAKLFYNKATKQFGVMKNYDAVGIDEITTFQFSDPDEMQSIMKSYLEAGKAAVDNVLFQSECGLILLGNIPLDKNMQPINSSYIQDLPEMFRESATMDRFHGFIEGWKIPRFTKDHIVEGWVLNSEYFSSVLHLLRYFPEYDDVFSTLVDVPHGCDLRDKKAVQRIATAYHKLLFPHIRSLSDIEPEQIDTFKILYDRYCLQPAMRRRQIIRTQCHRIDKEFKPEIAKFSVIGLSEETDQKPIEQ